MRWLADAPKNAEIEGTSAAVYASGTGVEDLPTLGAIGAFSRAGDHALVVGARSGKLAWVDW